MDSTHSTGGSTMSYLDQLPDPSGGAVERQSSKTLRKGISFFVGTCIIATCGYVLAGWDWLDSMYMVTITIFGVGYG